MRPIGTITISISLTLVLLASCSPSQSTPADGQASVSSSTHEGDNATVQQSANINTEHASRFNEISESLAPRKRELDEALRNGEWQSALDISQELEQSWAAAGREQSYTHARIEALVGLGRPHEALDLIDPDPGHRDTATSLTHALALAMLNRLDTATARGIADMLALGRDFPAGYPPTPNTQNEKIAIVRAARASDANTSANSTVAIREAKEALRLNPDLDLAAYTLARALSDEDRHDEAYPYWQQASRLPGTAGETARRMVKSIEHSKRLRDNPPTGVVPDGGPGTGG